MAVEEAGKRGAFLRRMLPRIVKACLKVFAILFVYALLSSFLNPFKNFLGDFYVATDVFFAIFILFIILSELVSGSIHQHFFNVAKNLLMLFYLFYIFEKGILALTVENIHVSIDLRVILTVFITINLLMLAKSMLNTVSFLLEKTELAEI